jgi:hypothetical protein
MKVQDVMVKDVKVYSPTTNLVGKETEAQH